MIIVKIGGSHTASPLLAGWLDAVSAGTGAVVLAPGGGPFADAVRRAQGAMRFSDAAGHDMALMAMAQYGRALVDLRRSFVLAESEMEIRDALARRVVPVWSPWPMLRDASGIPRSWDVTSDSLAVWLACELRASGIVLVKHVDAVNAPDLVDPAFHSFRSRFDGQVSIAGPASVPGAAEAFAAGRLPGHVLPAETA